MTEVTFELVEVTQQIKGTIVKNNKMGNIFNSKLILPFVLFFMQCGYLSSSMDKGHHPWRKVIFQSPRPICGLQIRFFLIETGNEIWTAVTC